MTRRRPHTGQRRTGPDAARAAALRPVRQAARAHDPVRDDRGSADLCAVDRQLPAQLAERPARRRAHRGAGARRGAERHGAGQRWRAQILDSVGAKAVAMKMGNAAPPARASPTCRRRSHHDIDMRDVSLVPRHRRCVRHAVRRSDNDVMRVVGPAPMGGDFVEIVLDEGPLRQAMLRFSRNILLLSLIISGDHRDAGLFRAALPAGAADAPHHRQHDGVPRRPGKSGARHRAVRRAATRSASPSASSPPCSATSPRCCSRRASSRRSASRCPRSTTTCATCSPRRSCSPTGCRSLPDPRVQRFAPKLMRSLERAIAFCQSTLSYGRAQEPPPDRRPVALEPLVEEVRETLGARRRRADRAGSSRSSAA